MVKGSRVCHEVQHIVMTIHTDMVSMCLLLLLPACLGVVLFLQIRAPSLQSCDAQKCHRLLGGGHPSAEAESGNIPRKQAVLCVGLVEAGCPGTPSPPPVWLQPAAQVMPVKHMTSWCELGLIFLLNAYTDVLWVS